MHKYFLEFAYGRPGLKSPSTLEQLNLQLESLKTACSMNLQAVSINDIVGYILKLSTTCLPFFSLILLQWSWENSDTKICDCVTLCKAGQEGSSNCRLASSAPSHLGFHSQPTPPHTQDSLVRGKALTTPQPWVSQFHGSKVPPTPLLCHPDQHMLPTAGLLLNYHWLFSTFPGYR